MSCSPRIGASTPGRPGTAPRRSGRRCCGAPPPAALASAVAIASSGRPRPAGPGQVLAALLQAAALGECQTPLMSYLGFLFASYVSDGPLCAVVRSTRHSTTTVLGGRIRAAVPTEWPAHCRWARGCRRVVGLIQPRFA